MTKGNGIKPTKLEKEMQFGILSVISTFPDKKRVKKLLPKIKGWEEDIETSTKAQVRRLLK